MAATSVVVPERTVQKLAARLTEVSGYKPGSPELNALLKLSTALVDRIVREVVPQLAAQLISESQQKGVTRR